MIKDPIAATTYAVQLNVCWCVHGGTTGSSGQVQGGGTMFSTTYTGIYLGCLSSYHQRPGFAGYEGSDHA